MKVKILGTGTAVPSLKRLSSSYLVTAGWGNILIDVGPSVVRRLLEFGYKVEEIDIIIITHFHPDHTADLVTFLFACNYGESERRKPLTIVGGKGIRAFCRKLSELYPWIVPLHYRLQIKTLPRGTWRIKDGSVTTTGMKHREESIGVRLEEKGKSVVFSGDTEYTPALARLAYRADLLVVECSFPVTEAKGHLNLAGLLSIVGASNPKMVLMSHLYPQWQEFDGPLPAPLLLAEDGMEIDV
jgi:ribonuclease BN (tRNA processing enzyme)